MSTKKTTYSDLQIVKRYISQIVDFIEPLIEDENMAIVLTCEVFEAHTKRAEQLPFESEQERLLWLQHKGRNLALNYAKHKRDEKIKAQAVRKAIHDCP